MIEARFFLENILANNATYTVNVGSDNPALPVSNAFNDTPTLAATPTSDANGVFEVDFAVNTFVHPIGSLGYGIGQFGGVITPMSFILGVARHEPAFFRFDGGNVELISLDDGIVCVNDDLSTVPTNKNIAYELPTHNTANYRLRITGLQPNSAVTLPLLYIGNYYLLGGYSYGFDSYPDAGHYRQTRSEAGIGYDELRYIQWNGKLSFPFVDDFGALRFLKEEIVEKSKPFFFQMNHNISTDVYFVKQRNNFLPESHASAIHATVNVDLIEWL